MASLNKVILIGNVTRDIELRYLANGVAVADMGMAINRRVKSGEDWVEKVTFLDVTLWRRQAEVAAEYAKKGKSVMVEGYLELDQWESPDGQKKSKLKVVCENLQLLGSAVPKSGETESPAPTVDAEGKIPF